MSLKAFHIFFIAVSTLLAFGFAAWSLYAFVQAGGVGSLLMGLAALLLGLVLVVYGRRFRQKFRDVGSL
ncbi:hypothetical protein GQ464_003100 [Rhodocaloribacter litoris]|uniref:hypothetical protein n=1 Tax=Rhodocaloribacter litoris TaxID=2558931 RepID=UPI001423A555|nr:hypothetical protein [Rhodocaloribacter litoris]QXD15952.1 hypothetical protein GQ464_003100 [Rhodocaloribacter litoris]GIV60144.1 MAG: hypothetical protein KatS3mg043_1233 [Rhodothermaceae bacterium]